jgi:hypothetical protein
MRLVARLLQDPKCRRPARQSQGLAPPEHEDLLLALRELMIGIAQPEQLERGVRRVELAFAAVDHDEVRERFVLVTPPRE